ncbi:MAG: hypothetical protein CMP75_03700 [Flavobacteriales bacterium]|nr:hypothetical protein [Flavobacteriales bacterium]|tara:strand:- start:641 stop:1456 length:816 start_codon:yes stop_codon:yes gene_type:complete
MKKAVLFLSFLIAFSACDKIDPDNFVDGEIIVQSEDVDRKILIEDFTGHKCQNCPEAAEEIHNIQNTFPNQVVAIAIHAGYFSEPNSPQAPYLTTDFRTEGGDEIHDFFGPQSYPNGMVNRSGYPSDFLSNYTDWGNMVGSLTGSTAKVRMDISYTINGNEMTVYVSTQAKASFAAGHNVVVCITEDHIIDWQTVEGQGNVSDYEHNHVLRDVVGSTWGQDVGELSTGDEVTNTFTCIIDPVWKLNNCNIVAYVYHTLNYEVVQVEEIHIE